MLNESSSSRVFVIYVRQLRMNLRILKINKNHTFLLFIREEMIVKILTKWSFGPQKMSWYLNLRVKVSKGQQRVRKIYEINKTLEV